MEIRVPQLAEGVTSGTVVSILVQEGDEITKDQTLLELETEKAVAPIPSSMEGKIAKIHVGEGDAVNVGQVIITLAGANGADASSAPAEAEEPSAPAPAAAASTTTVDVRVPQLAEGITSGTVVSIVAKEGDSIAKDETLLELETEKAVAPIPSTADGVVSKIHVKEGDSVNVGQVIASLSGSGGAAAPSSPSTPSAAPSPATPTAAAPVGTPQAGSYQFVSKTGEPPPASPSIRKMAKQLGIDLTRVKGSARGGRITIEDMRSYIAALQQGTAASGVAAPSGGTAIPFGGKIAPSSVDFSKFGSVKKEKMSILRKKIAEKMVESWTTIPHVTQYDEADITDLLALRKKYVEAYDKAGARLTVTSFVFKAVANTLQEYPIFNTSIDEVNEEIVYKNYFNIGLAVDTEQGLIVPVMKDVDKKDLLQISEDIQSLAEKTRDRKISLEDMQGGTFTISNQGGIGGDHFTPIINKPEVAILGVGQGSFKQRIVNKKPEIRMVMPLALSYDHRLIDGGKAAKFITDLVKAIEGFSEDEVKI